MADPTKLSSLALPSIFEDGQGINTSRALQIAQMLQEQQPFEFDNLVAGALGGAGDLVGGLLSLIPGLEGARGIGTELFGSQAELDPAIYQSLLEKERDHAQDKENIRLEAKFQRRLFNQQKQLKDIDLENAFKLAKAGDASALERVRLEIDSRKELAASQIGLSRELAELGALGKDKDRALTKDLRSEDRDFTAKQAEKARTFELKTIQSRFNAIEKQAEKAQQFSASEAEKGREFSSIEAEKGRKFQSGEVTKGREFSSGEAEKNRVFQASENEFNRELEADRLSSGENLTRESLSQTRQLEDRRFKLAELESVNQFKLDTARQNTQEFIAEAQARSFQNTVPKESTQEEASAKVAGEHEGDLKLKVVEYGNPYKEHSTAVLAESPLTEDTPKFAETLRVELDNVIGGGPISDANKDKVLKSLAEDLSFVAPLVDNASTEDVVTNQKARVDEILKVASQVFSDSAYNLKSTAGEDALGKSQINIFQTRANEYLTYIQNNAGNLLAQSAPNSQAISLIDTIPMELLSPEQRDKLASDRKSIEKSGTVSASRLTEIEALSKEAHATIAKRNKEHGKLMRSLPFSGLR